MEESPTRSLQTPGMGHALMSATATAAFAAYFCTCWSSFRSSRDPSQLNTGGIAELRPCFLKSASLSQDSLTPHADSCESHLSHLSKTQTSRPEPSGNVVSQLHPHDEIWRSATALGARPRLRTRRSPATAAGWSKRPPPR